MSQETLTRPNITAEIAAELMETQHYVCELPEFAGQVTDTERTNTLVGKNGIGTHPGGFGSYLNYGEQTTTEYEALQELWSFLGRMAAQTVERESQWDTDYQKFGRELRDHLNFVGGKEFYEATAGLAALWKSYLDADERNVLTILTQITVNTDNHRIRKSDEYVRDMVLNKFTDEEWQRYDGRIRKYIDKDGDPDHTRIVMLDDWIISGTQMQSAYTNARKQHPAFAKCMEINLIAATPEMLRDGFDLGDEGIFKPKNISPVKAYYSTRMVDKSTYHRGFYLSGTHSTVDFGFGNMLRGFVNSRAVNKGEVPPPALANVMPSYQYQKSRYRVDEDGRTLRRGEVMAEADA